MILWIEDRSIINSVVSEMRLWSHFKCLYCMNAIMQLK